MRPVILHPSDPLSPREVDFSYAQERFAAESEGLECALLRTEILVEEQSPARAVRSLPDRSGSEVPALYRGWMLRPLDYGLLYEALAEKGYRLINNPIEYNTGHLFPLGYLYLEGHTPRSVVVSEGEGVTWDAYGPHLRTFGDSPLVLKDYVKSRKHEWKEACFIPSASDRTAVERVVGRFLELQGTQFVGGLVFREYTPLRIVGHHARSGAPLAEEYRLFYLRGERLTTSGYWPEVSESQFPDFSRFDELARQIPSNFFTLDVARTAKGDLTAIELGDGQVAGLPEQLLPEHFYKALGSRLDYSSATSD